MGERVVEGGTWSAVTNAALSTNNHTHSHAPIQTPTHLSNLLREVAKLCHVKTQIKTIKKTAIFSAARLETA